MNKLIQFLPSNDPQLNLSHLGKAMQIAENVFATGSDPFQIDINDENLQWTIRKTPQCWTLILVDGECVGSAAVLPTSSETMREFLAGTLNENEMMEKVKANAHELKTADCLYLSGVSILPQFQNQGISAQAFIHTVEAAKKEFGSIRHLFCWTNSDASTALIEKIRSSTGWTIQEKKTQPPPPFDSRIS